MWDTSGNVTVHKMTIWFFKCDYWLCAKHKFMKILVSENLAYWKNLLCENAICMWKYEYV